MVWISSSFKDAVTKAYSAYRGYDGYVVPANPHPDHLFNKPKTMANTDLIEMFRHVGVSECAVMRNVQLKDDNGIIIFDLVL